MKEEQIHFGRRYVLTGEEIAAQRSLQPLFQAEVKRILELKEHFELSVREDLLVLFVEMYLRRFAIPYASLMLGKHPGIDDVPLLRHVLYACLVGRAVDDIVDADSQMFSHHDSLVLQAHYLQALNHEHPGDRQRFEDYLFESTRYTSPVLRRSLRFEDLEDDIYVRIRYFFLPAERYAPEAQRRLRTYVGVLLSYLDLTDAIADGTEKPSATTLSNHLWQEHLNDEGKILLNAALLAYRQQVHDMISESAQRLIGELRGRGLHYAAQIVEDARNDR